MTIANHRTPVGPGGTGIPVIALDWAHGQVVAIGAASAASAVFSTQHDCTVELCCSTDTWYTVGEVPTAAASAAGNQFIASGSVRYVYVPANQKIAVIQASAGGNAGMVPGLQET